MNRRWQVLAAAVLSLAGTLLAAGSLNAQSEHEVSGVIVGPDGSGASGAMVVALALPDSTLTRWATTGGDGAFTVGPLTPGDYLLQVTLIGHETVRRPIAIVDQDVGVGTIGIEVLAVEVDPLVISVDHVPFINRRDTLSFNALAFEVRPNATVEDLLKRLPGVEVEADGSITAQGEEVQNVLVDGKEFFGTDPTVATKNLPADAVQRVEVYDKESDTAEFTGIPDGEEERTINLELKEEARRGYFGNMSGGFGADAGNTGSIEVPGDLGIPRDTRIPYDGKLSINRFSPTTQLAVIGNASNVGQPGFRGGDGGGSSSSGFTESLGLGFNGSRDFGSESWLRGSYFFGMTDNLRNQTLDEERLLGSEVASLVEGVSENQSDNLSHELDLNSQVEFADGHDLRIRGGLQTGNADQSSTNLQTQTVMGVPLNRAATNYRSDGDDFGVNGRLTWRKRLNESGRSLIAEARLDHGDSDQRADLRSMLEGVDSDGQPADRDILQEQANTGRTLSHSVRLSMTEPLSRRNSLEIFGERRAVDENQGKSVFDLDDGTPVFNPILSSAFDRTYTYLRGGLRFSRNSGGTRLVFGLQVQNSDLEGVVLDPEALVDPISTGFTHLLPLADLRFQLKEGRNLRFRYNTSTREPTMAQFQPFVDNDDPLNVYVGNPDLDPEYRHQLRAEYRLFDQFSFMNLFTYASVNLTQDNIAQSRFVDQTGRQVITPVNSGQAWSTNVGANFGTPIRSIGARIQLDYRLNYARESAFVNEVENRSRILANTVNLSVENRNKSRFEIRAGGGLSFNDVDYSLNQELNQNYINPRLFADGSYFMGAWTVSSRLNFQGYDAEVFGPNLNVTLWEASITRLIMNERAEIQLAAYDLLNQNQGVSVTNTSSFNRTQRVQSLGRYMMLRFNYHLGSPSMRGSNRRR